MFKQAKAIFIKGGNDGINNFANFRAKIYCNDNVKIRITANYFYKLYINKEVVSFGPCRTAYGFARVDEIDITKFLKDGENFIDIVVAGYNCKSISTCKFNSFVTAEVESNGSIVAYTGKDFKGYDIESRIKKVYRYSKQRHFTEVIDFNLGNDFSGKEVQVVEVIAPKYISRGVNYPIYSEIYANSVETMGNYKVVNEIKRPNYSWHPKDSENWGYYKDDEIKYNPFGFIKSLEFTNTNYNIDMPLSLQETEYAIFDLNGINTGFLKFDLSSESGCDIAVGFSEYCDENKFNFVEYFDVCNAFEYILTSGKTEIETFEPYTAKKIIIVVKKGQVTVDSVGIRKYEGNFDNVKKVEFIDNDLNLIYDASVKSFIQNALDLYTDCPSRERAGWLCDSYFTARTEYFLTGKTTVEQNFLENYTMFYNTGEYEEGMIPMCYPSDFNGQFIPQWSMWFIIELHEYIYERNGKLPFSKFEKMVSGLLKYYEKYENEDGLLEKLSNWNFIEWSKANQLTNGVNYPTNFLYSKVLDCVADFYNDNKTYYGIDGSNYSIKAKLIRKTAIEQSFDGKFFHDLAVRDENGKLTLTEDITEICQYYAIVFGKINENIIINDGKYSYLKNTVLNVFNKDRTEFPEIEKINMFIGVYLKLLALESMCEKEQIIKTVKEYFLPMAQKTNTLWEYVTVSRSLCHGFASFATVVMTNAAENLKLIK